MSSRYSLQPSNEKARNLMNAPGSHNLSGTVWRVPGILSRYSLQPSNEKAHNLMNAPGSHNLSGTVWRMPSTLWEGCLHKLKVPLAASLSEYSWVSHSVRKFVAPFARAKHPLEGRLRELKVFLTLSS